MPGNNSEVKKKKSKFVDQKHAAPFRKKKFDKNMST